MATVIRVTGIKLYKTPPAKQAPRAGMRLSILKGYLFYKYVHEMTNLCSS